MNGVPWHPLHRRQQGIPMKIGVKFEHWLVTPHLILIYDYGEPLQGQKMTLQSESAALVYKVLAERETDAPVTLT